MTRNTRRAPCCLLEVVGAEARHAREAVGEVEVAALLELAPLLVGDHLAQRRAQLVVARATRPARDRLELAVDADPRLQAGDQVEVRAARARAGALEQLTDARMARSGEVGDDAARRRRLARRPRRA